MKYPSNGIDWRKLDRLGWGAVPALHFAAVKLLHPNVESGFHQRKQGILRAANLLHP